MILPTPLATQGTFSPQLSPLDSQLSTFNSQLSTFNSQLSTLTKRSLRTVLPVLLLVSHVGCVTTEPVERAPYVNVSPEDVNLGPAEMPRGVSIGLEAEANVGIVHKAIARLKNLRLGNLGLSNLDLLLVAFGAFQNASVLVI